MLDLLLRKYIRQGRLAVRYPSGITKVYGQGAPQVAIAIRDRAALAALSLDPDLKLGELYMDGLLVIEQGDVVGLLDILMGNIAREIGRASCRERV